MNAPRLYCGLALACLMACASGCALCQSCDDHAYPAYGGIWQRTNRNHGRVGSVFNPAGAKVAVVEQAAERSAPSLEEVPAPAEDRDAPQEDARL